MMKKLLTILGVLATTAAYAKVPDQGFYLDAGAGVASISYYGNSGTTGLLRIDGGYNINQIIGVQLGVNNYFSSSITNNQLGNYTVSGYGYDLSFIPNIAIGTNAPVNVFFRLGGGYDNMNSSIGNNSGFVDVLGAGVRYDISSHLGITGQWIGRGLLVQSSPINYSQNDFIANVGFYF